MIALTDIQISHYVDKVLVACIVISAALWLIGWARSRFDRGGEA